MALTFQQFQELRRKGLSTEQIISFEAGNKPAGATAFPQEQPEQQKKGFFSKVASLTKGVGNALTASEQTLGRGIAAAGRNIFGSVGKDIETQQAGDAKVQELVTAAREETDPEKKRRLLSIAANLGASVRPEEIDPGLNLTNKEVLGAAGGTLLDIASFGTYGSAAKGAKTGQLLTKSKMLTSAAGKLGLKATAKQAVKVPLKEKVIEGALLGYGSDVTSKLRDDQASAKPGLGTALGVGLPFASALVSGLSKRVAGFTTGTGKDVIQNAVDNPDVVGDAVKKYAKTPEAKQELVDVAKDSINDYLRKRSKDYGDEIANLTLRKPIKSTAVTDDFVRAVKDFGGKLDDNGDLVFQNSKLTSSDRTNLINAWDDIKQWTDFTPAGLDNLRQNISNYVSQFRAAGNTRADVVLGSVKDSLTKYIDDAAPGYKQVLNKYGTRTEVAKELLAELSQKGNAKPSTQLRQVMNIFKKDPKVLQNIEEVMGEKQAKQFLSEISGAILSGWTPEGKVQNWFRLLAEGGAGAAAFVTGGVGPGLGALATGAVASSPRIVGKAARVAGKAVKKGVGTAIRRGAIKAVNR